MSGKPAHADRAGGAGEKYLVVSLGSIGKRHLTNLRQLRPQAQIGVLRLQSQDSASPVPAGADRQFFSLQDALAFEPKAAIIASPASTHMALALPLAAAGISLLVEKPVADTSQHIRQFLDACDAGNITVGVGYNLRFLPSLQECKRIIDTGVIGQVLGARAEVGQYLPDWRPSAPYQDSVSARRELGGGALLELSHEIDYLCWILGMPTAVQASGGQYSDLALDVEDMVELCLDYGTPRRLVNIHLDFLQRAPSRNCKFIGEKGTLTWNGITDRIELFTAATGAWQVLDTFALANRNQGYLDELGEFLDGPGTPGPVLCTARQAVGVLHIVEAARVSMETGNRVPVSDV